MKGCRPLTDREVLAVAEVLGKGRHPARDRALFFLGIRAGYRVSELLSIRLGDVWENGQILDRVSVARQHMKKKVEGRTVVLHPEAKTALEALANEILKAGLSDPQTFLFRSQKGGNRPLGRSQAWHILVRAYAACGLSGRIGTHGMRKTFAKRVHAKLGRDLVKTQKAMGHRNVNSTVSYLSFDEEEIDDAILKS